MVIGCAQLLCYRSIYSQPKLKFKLFLKTCHQLTQLLSLVTLGGGQQDQGASTVLRPMKYSQNFDNGWNNMDSVDYNTNNTTTSFTTTNYSNSPTTQMQNNYNNDNSFVYEHSYNNAEV